MPSCPHRYYQKRDCSVCEKSMNCHQKSKNMERIPISDLDPIIVNRPIEKRPIPQARCYGCAHFNNNRCPLEDAEPCRYTPREFDRKCRSSFHFLFIHLCLKGHKVCRAERCNNFNEKEL